MPVTKNKENVDIPCHFVNTNNMMPQSVGIQEVISMQPSYMYVHVLWSDFQSRSQGHH